MSKDSAVSDLPVKHAKRRVLPALILCLLFLLTTWAGKPNTPAADQSVPHPHIEISATTGDQFLPSSCTFAYVETRAFSDEELIKLICSVCPDPVGFTETVKYSKQDYLDLLARVDDSPDRVFEPAVQELRAAMEQAHENASPSVVQLEDALRFGRFYSSEGPSYAYFDVSKDEGSFVWFRDAGDYVVGSGLANDILRTEPSDYAEWIQAEEPSLPFTEALALCSDFTAMAETGLSLYFYEPCAIINNNVLKRNGWKAIFTRQVGDLHMAYEDNQYYYVDDQYLPAAFATGPQEFCVFVIDEDGLCEIWWQGAKEIVSTLQKEPSITAEEALSLSKEYLYGIYDGDLNGFGAPLDICINSISLNTSCIASHDGTAAYVPTWCIGYEYKWANVNSEEPWSYDCLFIHALTGEYIEPRVSAQQIGRYIDID